MRPQLDALLKAGRGAVQRECSTRILNQLHTVSPHLSAVIRVEGVVSRALDLSIPSAAEYNNSAPEKPESTLENDALMIAVTTEIHLFVSSGEGESRIACGQRISVPVRWTGPETIARAAVPNIGRLHSSSEP